MDRKLQLIAHLYDEDIDGLEPLGSLLDDPELRAEYEAIGETRFTLEQRERVRPDPRLVNAIVASALRNAPPRPATGLRLVRTTRFWFPVLSAAATVLLLVLVNPWQMASPTIQHDELSVAESEAFPAAENLLKALPPAPPAVAGVAREVDTDAPALHWDTGDDLRHLSRRIERLGAAGIDEWDNPAVPLEALPTSAGRNGLIQTGASRPRK